VVGRRIAPSCRRHDGPIIVASCAGDVVPDLQLRVVNVTLVMTDGPLGGFLCADGIGPPEAHDAGSDGDVKTPRFGFGASTVRTGGPRCCRLE
ncbi:MAG: hypothetical protein K2X56_21300, partial [Mycobacterium pseudokansasii]|uniref:hypothetical protein n=1 Tax=Mycobacterium pseudokansasii TaxID=2341080 RepID=UPI0023F175F9